jgi:hypothetical protein
MWHAARAPSAEVEQKDEAARTSCEFVAVERFAARNEARQRGETEYDDAFSSGAHGCAQREPAPHGRHQAA